MNPEQNSPRARFVQTGQQSEPQANMSPESLSPVARRLFGMIEFDENERLVAEIRKHPFGLFVIYLTGFLVAAVLLIVCIAAGSFVTGELTGGTNTNQVRSILALVGVVTAGFTVLATLIGGYIYRSNVILVTNEKLAQVLRPNIIDRKISQLSIGDVQDVTVSQKGLFARLFNYGTLVIETSGEQQNYSFTYAPMPYQSSKAIVNAHEENLKQYGN